MGIAKNDRGLTLVEIVVSLSILVLLILSIGAALTNSIRSDTYNQERHIADQLAHGLSERLIDFAAQGTASFNALIANNFNGTMPTQAAIPGVRPSIVNEPANDRLYNDFDGDGVADFGLGSKNIYVYQMLIDDIPIGGQTGFLKQVTIRIYYANQNANPAQVNQVRHPVAGGTVPRRLGAPISEVSTYISVP